MLGDIARLVPTGLTPVAMAYTLCPLTPILVAAAVNTYETILPRRRPACPSLERPFSPTPLNTLHVRGRP